MEKIAYDYLIDTTKRFWEQWIQRFNPIELVDENFIGVSVKNCSTYIQQQVQLLLNTPSFRPYRLCSSAIHTEVICCRMKGSDAQLEYSTLAERSLLYHNAQHFLKKHSTLFTKATDNSIHPLKYALTYKQDRIETILGFSYYEAYSNTHLIILGNLRSPNSFPLENYSNQKILERKKQFYKYYENVLLEDFTVDMTTFAAAFNTNTQQFTRLFKKYAHCTLNEFHNHRRLLKALELLQFSDFSKKKIALELGYCTLSPLRIAFYKHFNIDYNQISRFCIP